MRGTSGAGRGERESYCAGIGEEVIAIHEGNEKRCSTSVENMTTSSQSRRQYGV